MLPSILTITISIRICSAFNVETRHVETVTLSDFQTGGWFGQSIILDKKRLNPVTAYISASIYRGNNNGTGTAAPDGAIYKCLIGANESARCSQRSFEPGSGMGMTIIDVADEGLLVCAPQWTYQCRNANLPLRMVGNCYILEKEDFEDCIPKAIESPFVRDCPGGLDIIFLLDGSGSINDTEFYLAKLWLVEFMRSYRTGMDDGEVYVGLIQYSGYTLAHSCDEGRLTRRLKVEMPLGSYNFTEVKRIVMDIPSLGDCTLTGDAINVTTQHFLARGRQDNVAVMIVVTDGMSYDSVLEAANHAREKGITVIAVGIGNEIDANQLGEIADSNENKFNVSEYGSLFNIIADLQEAIIAAEGSFLESNHTGASSNSTNHQSQYMLGMAAVITKDNTLYISAIGAIDGMGSLLSSNVSNLSQSETLTKESLMSLIHESIPRYTAEDNYLGYSMTSGFYYGRGREWLAVGMPRFKGYGAVLLFPSGINQRDIELRASTNASILESDDPQIGAYFGHTLTTLDIDEDGFEDLFVGAPLYSRTGLDDFDEGSVTIVYGSQSSERKFKRKCILVGFASSSRFGMDITAVGDLDRDGYQDVAIGAPGYNNQQGEVVIYYGNIHCPSKYQRIPGAISGFEMPYFGYSIASVEVSAYESVLLVGSPRVGSFSILRTRPVVDVNVTMVLLDAWDNEMTEMGVVGCLRDQNNGKSCLFVKVCFNISRRDRRTESFSEKAIELFYQILLESDRADSRLVFSSNEEQIFSGKAVVDSSDKCVTHRVMLPAYLLSRLNVVDFSKPAIISLLTNMSRDFDNVVLSPVLAKAETTVKRMINFTRGCLTSDECIYDLLLEDMAELANPIYMYETNEVITMKIKLTNLKDPAFFSKVMVTSSLASVTKLNSNCSFLEDDRIAISYRYGIFGSLMFQNMSCEMEISFSLRYLARYANETEFDIVIRAYSLMKDGVEAADDTPENNAIKVIRKVKYATSFNIIGASDPSDIHYWRNTSHFGTIDDVSEKGRFGEEDSDVLHKYEVANTGHFTVYNASIQFTWPAFTSSETATPILYLYAFSCEPKTLCSCNLSDICNNVNPLKLDFDQKNHTRDKATLCGPQWNETQVPDYEIDSFEPFTTVKIACDEYIDSVMCNNVKCEIASLNPQQFVEIEAKMKFWIPTFKLQMANPKIYLESTLSVGQSNNTYFPENISVDSILTSTHQYFTVSTPQPAKPMDLTLILISIVIGIILMIVLILIFWKCGFFESQYKLELRRRAMMLTEEEVELENSLPRNIKKTGKSSMMLSQSSLT